MSTNSISQEIERLTVRERLELIDRIWESLPDSICTEDVPEWHLAEIARRRSDVQANPGEGRPWREALDDLGTTS